MKTNMGTADRAIRILIAAIIGVMYYEGRISGLTATIALIVAGIFVVTSFISFCPLYFPFGINTKKKSVSRP